MGIEFGKNARKQVTRGDMVASFQYVNGEEAFVLWRLGTLNSTLALKQDGCVVICLSAAWKYTDDAYLVQQSRKYAEVMGFGDSARQAFKIASFIQDMLIELVTMKPEPDGLQTAKEKMSNELIELGIDGNKVVAVLH